MKYIKKLLKLTYKCSHGCTVQQVAHLWLTDRATAYVRKVHCAVVSTASGSVQDSGDAVVIRQA